MINLLSSNIEKSHQYEVIVTTENEGIRNSAPFGMVCTGKNTVMFNIFKGSKTLENILETEKFIVNITSNPLFFTYATLDKIPSQYLEKNNSIKGSDSYFKCVITDIKSTKKRNGSIDKENICIIKAKAEDMVINVKNPRPLNRAKYLLIESIYNYQNFYKDPNYYMPRIKEAKRVITKVGTKKEKKAIKMIYNDLINH